MPRLPGEFNVSGREHWLVCVQMRERVYRVGRGHVHSVCGGDVQDECRDRRVHGVRRRQVLWSGGGYRGERMHGVPGALRRAGGERGSVELYMQCRVHGRRWRAVCGVRCGQVQGRDRGRGVRRLRGRQVLRGDGGYGRGHMQGVPGALRRAGGERGSIGVRVRGGLHGAERRAVRGVRCRQVQGRDRGGSVHRLRGGQVLWGGGGYGRGHMHDVPGELRRAGGERGSVGMYLRGGLHGAEWWAVRGLCCGQVQGRGGGCSMHVLRGGQVLWGDGADGRGHMLGVPGECKRAGGERGSVGVYLRGRLHGAERRAVRGVRCGQVQGRDRGRGVRRLRGRQVLRGDGGYGRGHMQGVPGALRRAGGERGSIGVRVRGGLHGAERRAVRGVRCRQVQGRDRGGSVHRLRGGQVLWGGGGYGRGRMQGVPSALRRAGGERGSVGVRVHCWLHGTECQHVPELWSRQVQGGFRRWWL